MNPQKTIIYKKRSIIGKISSLLKKEGIIIIIRANKTIYSACPEPCKGYEITLKNKNTDAEVANMVITYKKQGIQSLPHNTRRNSLDWKYVLFIEWIETMPAFRGKGYALLLLICGICYASNIYKNVNYVVLHDDSDQSNNIKNIYNKLGFVNQGKVELDTSKTIKPDGPEKQLLINHKFFDVANTFVSIRFKKGGLKGTRRKGTRRKGTRRKGTRRKGTY